MKDLLEQLQQLAPLAAAATAGPWEVIPNSEHTDSVHSQEANHTENFGLGDFRSSNLCMNSGGFAHDADAAFIAAARNLLTPENLTLLIGLLSGIGSLQQAVAELTGQRDAALLYGEACEKRRMELLELATKRLPSYEEMLAATTTLKGAGHV